MGSTPSRSRDGSTTRRDSRRSTTRTARYVRRYVPELADVPDKYLAEPWTMPDEIQSEVGCVIGTDYPGPIVDHAQARREALARYGAARD